MLPIDGLTFAGKQLVMDASTALRAAALLGAHTFVPIHYSQRPIRGLLRCPSGLADLQRQDSRKLQHAGLPAVPMIRYAPTGVPIRIEAPPSIEV